jgi:large subunit ribosomal protein L3
MKQLGRCGLICKKMAMSQIFEKSGKFIPVTILHVATNYIISIKEYEHGNGVQLAAYQQKIQRLSNSLKGIFKIAKVGARKKIKEFRVSKQHNYKKIGNINITHLNVGQYLDITGFSIGKGCAGVMKRHNFKGLEATHGISINHRSAGSTGQCQDPGKVFKGKKMSGHLGAKKNTKQNVKIVDIDINLNILVVKGSVPGHKNSYLYIKDSLKKNYVK